MIPPSRPKQPETVTADILSRAGFRDAVALLGIRGYYRDTMGRPGANDYGIYDDAIILASPSAYAAFNANTDPSRGGMNPKLGKPYALLKPGLYSYRLGTHRPGKPGAHLALRQAGPVTVIRRAPGRPEYEERGEFYIHIHRGGNSTTSSEGCQTLPPAQWPGFISLLTQQLSLYGQATVPYLLTDPRA